MMNLVKGTSKIYKPRTIVLVGTKLRVCSKHLGGGVGVGVGQFEW